MSCSNYLKAALLHKLRFIQGCPYIATEVGQFSADVAAIRKNMLIEFETKISMADFRADFKKPKHRAYREAASRPTLINPWIPHQFYFVVPEKIAKQVAASLISYPGYGLIAIRETTHLTTWNLRETPVTLIKPKVLHKFAIEQQVYKQFLARMSSELASLATLRIKSKTAEINYDLLEAPNKIVTP